MPLLPTGPDDDGWTTFVVAVSVVALATLGATVGLGHAVIDGPAETTAPGLPVLFGIALVASLVLGMILWGVSPLPGQTLPLFTEADADERTMLVVGLSLAAVLAYGTAGMNGYYEFVTRTGPHDTLFLVNFGVQLSTGTALGARALAVAVLS